MAKTFKSIEQILTPDELALYKRHIDDGNSLDSLTEEFDMTFKELHVWFQYIEFKLRKEFQA